MRAMELAARMKKYEEASCLTLPGRMPIIVRVDGKAFSKYTSRLLGKPFNREFISVMESVAGKLCEEIQGAALAYVQSDEVSVLIHGYKRHDSDTWFANQLQKIVSVSAAIASATFTAESWRMFKGRLDPLSLDHFEPAYFDARAFVLPESEAVNYFVWRQRDALRNSVQMHARSLLSHEQCHKKNTQELKDMCAELGKPWEALTPSIRKGRCVRKVTLAEGRQAFQVDTDIPLFGENRAYVEDLLRCESESDDLRPEP